MATTPPEDTVAPSKSAPPADASSPEATITSFLSSLPRSGDAFTQFDSCAAPSTDSFQRYLPSPADARNRAAIPTEKDRCLIRSLRAKPSRRKRASPTPPVAQPLEKKRHTWSTLERERKQACLRVALAAACSGRGADEGVLGRLRRGWAANPRKKQMVNGEVRRALCISLPRWSMLQLREYVARAGIEGGHSKTDLMAAVHAHLAPEE